MTANIASGSVKNDNQIPIASEMSDDGNHSMYDTNSPNPR